jgi:acyl-CoA dehydrogenase
MDLNLTDEEREIRDWVRTFVRKEIMPLEPEVLARERRNERGLTEEELTALQDKAKQSGFFGVHTPEEYGGMGLGAVMNALVEAELGRSFVQFKFGGDADNILFDANEEQKKRYLVPTINGDRKSCFAITEPGAGSDARAIRTSAVRDGDEWVINGEKYYISGAGDPRCKIMICMVRTNPDAASHLQQSQILVPMDTPGVEIVGPMLVFGHDDAPHGHMHIRLTNVRVPKENILLGEGRGFEISQLRLGPGRIHHCMRSIGAAERALQLMVERGLGRSAFGKPIIALGKNTELVSRARIEIEAMRLMVLRAAKAMDLMGNADARVWVSAVKAMVPERVCEIIDQAIQVHGATGVSQWTPLADMYTSMRTLRMADGPDEVHHMVVGRAEIARYQAQG